MQEIYEMNLTRPYLSIVVLSVIAWVFEKYMHAFAHLHGICIVS